jgi:hypothetical protein
VTARDRQVQCRSFTSTQNHDLENTSQAAHSLSGTHQDSAIAAPRSTQPAATLAPAFDRASTGTVCLALFHRHYCHLSTPLAVHFSLCSVSSRLTGRQGRCSLAFSAAQAGEVPSLAPRGCSTMTKKWTRTGIVDRRARRPWRSVPIAEGTARCCQCCGSTPPYQSLIKWAADDLTTDVVHQVE